MTKEAQRPQDYEAMAEENRRLMAENARMKAKAAKPPHAPGMFLSLAKRALPFIGAMAAFGLIVGVVAIAAIAERKEKETPVDCYVMRMHTPKQPWFGWDVIGRRPRNVPDIVAASGASEAEARDFIAKWKLEMCK